MIRLEQVAKRFGSIEALRPIDLEIHRGEWLGLFGHNGSGKTTLIRILLGLSMPSDGRVLIEGRMPDRAGWRAFRRRIGFMPERIQFHEHLTGAETLRYFARLRGVDGATEHAVLEQVGIADAADRKVEGYSKGMRQRLNLAQALLGDPEVLVFDEPIEGLDPNGVRDFFALLRAGGSRTVVLSSHRIAEVCGRVDRACFLSDGAVKALGEVGDLLRGLQSRVTIRVYPTSDSDGALADALQRLGAVSLVERSTSLVVQVPQGEKTAFLLALHEHRAVIRHLHVEESTLEEVYFDAD